MNTATDLINHILNILGVGDTAPERLALLGSSELSKIAIPDSLAPRITAQLTTKDAARKDAELIKHFRGTTYGEFDSELEAKLQAAGKLPANWAEIKSTTPKTVDRILSIMSTTPPKKELSVSERAELMRLKNYEERMAKQNGTPPPAKPTGADANDPATLYKRQLDHQRKLNAQAQKEGEKYRAENEALRKQQMEAKLDALIPKDRINLPTTLPEHTRKAAIQAALDSYLGAKQGKLGYHEGALTVLGQDGKPLVINGADGKPLPADAWVTEALKENSLLRDGVNKGTVNNPTAQKPQLPTGTPEIPKPLTVYDRARAQAAEQTIKP
jgi:uncharacterized small protein (DUF1192 family)